MILQICAHDSATEQASVAPIAFICNLKRRSGNDLKFEFFFERTGQAPAWDSPDTDCRAG
jgi:hypothetical protein